MTTRVKCFVLLLFCCRCNYIFSIYFFLQKILGLCRPGRSSHTHTVLRRDLCGALTPDVLATWEQQTAAVNTPLCLVTRAATAPTGGRPTGTEASDPAGPDGPYET
ncbi:hypothetical protein EYF80_059465 [Liparis tanakae]|uniref:Uncharacterized protein n=1 Tax=Liparis tanakae TaxID=230148 RepID=A0A4Z2ENL6_9TELE|nr:hypothetical protein EYF80_059465 [Liparis tanakae]